MKTSYEEDAIEARLRAAAPNPAPELRQRVLQRCQAEYSPQPVFAWYMRWRLAGALATVVLLCGFGSGLLDAQSQAMIAGDKRPGSGKFSTVRADHQDFGIALRWRMRQLVLLLYDRHNG